MTCYLGYPEAPSGIKIIKTVDGAQLSWDAPACPQRTILGYSVYLAVVDLKTFQNGGKFEFLTGFSLN